MNKLTNEQAIEILKDLWRWEHPNWLEKDIRQALEKGIEALENQLTKEEAIYLIECLGGHTARCGVKDTSIKCMDKLSKIKELENEK